MPHHQDCPCNHHNGRRVLKAVCLSSATLSDLHAYVHWRLARIFCCLHSTDDAREVSGGYGVYPDYTANNRCNWGQTLVHLTVEPKASTLHHIAAGLFYPSLHRINKLKRGRRENFQILEVSKVWKKKRRRMKRKRGNGYISVRDSSEKQQSHKVPVGRTWEPDLPWALPSPSSSSENKGFPFSS